MREGGTRREQKPIFLSRLSSVAFAVVADSDRYNYYYTIDCYKGNDSTTENTYRTEIYMHAYCLNTSDNTYVIVHALETNTGNKGMYRICRSRSRSYSTLYQGCVLYSEFCTV